VLAARSLLYRPKIEGLCQHAFSINTYAEAVLLDAHIKELGTVAQGPGARTVLIVGAGLAGIEAAC